MNNILYIILAILTTAFIVMIIKYLYLVCIKKYQLCYNWSGKSFKSKCLNIFDSILSIIESLLTIFTLGNLRFNLRLDFITWRLKKGL